MHIPGRAPSNSPTSASGGGWQDQCGLGCSPDRSGWLGTHPSVPCICRCLSNWYWGCVWVGLCVTRSQSEHFVSGALQTIISKSGFFRAQATITILCSVGSATNFPRPTEFNHYRTCHDTPATICSARLANIKYDTFLKYAKWKEIDMGLSIAYVLRKNWTPGGSISCPHI